MTETDLEQLTDEQLEAMLADRKRKKEEAESLKRQSYETLKEETISNLVEMALNVNTALVAFKSAAFQEMKALYSILKEYSKRHEDGEGNFTIENAENNLKIVYSRQNQGYFDERANQAEKHIIDFVNSQFAGDPRTKKLITGLLERKKGALDIKLVQKLYKMEADYDDQNWKDGIKLLKESWKDSDSKDYIRFFTKQNGEYKLINLSFSSIALED